MSFTAISPRVSWIQIRCRTRTAFSGDDTACFVTCYAPTEVNSTESDLDDFYLDVQQAINEAQQSGSSHKPVPILRDFTINLGSNTGEVKLSQYGIIGSCLRDGASQNCGRFISFCDQNGLSVVQTFGHPSVLREQSC